VIPIPSTDHELDQNIDGIGRGNYLISIVGLAIVAAATFGATGVAAWGYLYGAILALFPTYLRLKNLEWSNLLLPVILLPGVNLLLAITLVVMPENFAQTRKLDRDSKQVLIFGGFILALTVFLFGWSYYRIWRNSQPLSVPQASVQQP
jgi:hypothetical protein